MLARSSTGVEASRGMVQEFKSFSWELVLMFILMLKGSFFVFGAAIGAFLLGLLLVAMFVKEKKKARLEELERRAYEEEALQVSMAGHVIRAHNVHDGDHHHSR
ncbi:hypothetical protein E3N88_27099 [Mikania micrantha]|uniref:Uncharacterized protein n=1 Tax=Mikania micrantha TaxID=192012 RepID=A0A5N6MVW3_9ASTR|nr:hypothetical protein E3N88_27099 [Mikania micrantha]